MLEIGGGASLNYGTLQHIATHCRPLQHTTHCSILQTTTTHYILQHTTNNCNTLWLCLLCRQGPASKLLHARNYNTATPCNQLTATCCNTLVPLFSLLMGPLVSLQSLKTIQITIHGSFCTKICSHDLCEYI